MIGYLVRVHWDVTFLCVWIVFTALKVKPSRKFTMVLFASIVIFKPFTPRDHDGISCTVLCGVLLKVARPSRSIETDALAILVGGKV